MARGRPLVNNTSLHICHCHNLDWLERRNYAPILPRYRDAATRVRNFYNFFSEIQCFIIAYCT